MPNDFWPTLFGGFLSAMTGALLFLIQRYVEKKDRDRDLLFSIYQKIRMPLDYYGRDIDAYLQRGVADERRWTELEGLALLVKDKKLRRHLYFLITQKPHSKTEIESTLNKIKMKLSGRLLEEIKKREQAGEATKTPEV